MANRAIRAGWWSEARSIILMNFTVAVVLTLLFVMFRSRITPQLIASVAGYNLIFSFVIGTTASLAIPRIAIRIHRYPPVKRWPIYLVALIAIAVAGSTLAQGLLTLFGLLPWALSVAGWLRTAMVGTLITVTLGVGSYVVAELKERLERTSLQLRTQQLEREKALKLAAEAQLSALQARLQPHFLFNTINSVLELIREDPQRAEVMLERLSRVLRYSLESQHQPLVPLDQELKLVSDYLEIERERFGDRLRFHIDVPDELYYCQVPPYSLQTLVENSMKYALAPRRHGGMVWIRAWREGAELGLEVGDDGPGFTEAEVKAGHGLDVLRQRITTLFGEDGELRIFNDHGARVRLRLPVRVAMPQ